ncbi:MAG TPA: DNA glycosylase [Thermodesulfobacteriota bacterium]|nr:DNA glycosylase [Thermodesulfobacteriota bacterium]
MTSQLRIRCFSLQATLECGQFFRFTKVLDTYIVQTSGRIFSLRQKGDSLFYEGADEPFLIQFFRLGDDLDLIYREIDRDPFIHLAIKKYRGLRVIRQDPWECLLSFLCSSAKAISHIRAMIEVLCRFSGEKISWGNHIGYQFPEPRCIETPLQLEPVRAGFRTKYLINASQCIDRNRLLSLRGLPYKDARKQLMHLSGVGKKVADCTLLYSLDFLQAFPMDTWIKRGLREIYFKGRKVGEGAMEKFVSDHFGRYAGYAQLYLFHFWRHHPSKGMEITST